MTVNPPRLSPPPSSFMHVVTTKRRKRKGTMASIHGRPDFRLTSKGSSHTMEDYCFGVPNSPVPSPLVTTGRKRSPGSTSSPSPPAPFPQAQTDRHQECEKVLEPWTYVCTFLFFRGPRRRNRGEGKRPVALASSAHLPPHEQQGTFSEKKNAFRSFE
mgnify:CR=1 FL=1